MATLRLASYNVHRAIGRDRRCEPERILAVVREIDADVLALQEVEAHDNGGDLEVHGARVRDDGGNGAEGCRVGGACR